MSDVPLLLEALSSLTSCSVQEAPGPSQMSPQDLVNVVALRQFYKQEGFKELDYPSLGSISLVDTEEADLYSAPPALQAPQPPQSTITVKVNPRDFFDRKWDYDFTKVKDGDRTFLRGNEHYTRPCGWRRVALNVTSKYDNETWLGTGASSWPVSYQGLHMDGSLGLILTRRESGAESDPGFLDEAAQNLVEERTAGRGIFSTPDLALAEKHCKTFKSKTNGRTYKVLLQNRINPEKREVCLRDKVWVVYVPEDHTPVQTRALVQDSIRPYGLLLKLV